MDTLTKTPAKPGQRFGVYNGSAKATLISANTQEVTYTFDHDLEKVWSHSRTWFDSSTFPLETK